MKKSLLFVMFILFIQLIDAQTVTVGVLTDKYSGEAQPLLKQLQDEIQAVVGQSATIVFGEILENDFNTDTAKANYELLLQNQTDIILAFGVVNNMMIYNEKSYTKPVIVFGSVNNDFINLPEDQKTSEINNITYVIAPFSYSKDLEAFKSLHDYKKVGILVDDFLPDALPLNSLFDKMFAQSDVSYTIIKLSEIAASSNVLNGVDAVYLAGGFHLNTIEFSALVETINQKKLPSFSAFGKKDVEKGILATNQPENNIDQFFRRIALNVEAIISGTNASELPLYILYKNRMSINYNTATQIDFPFRYSLLATSDFIGGNIEVSSESSLSILDIMNTVVGNNLTLKSEKKNIELSDQDVKTAKSDYLPELSASASAVYIDPKVAEVSNGQNPEFSTSGNLTLNQLIYSEGVAANTDIQKSLKEAQKEVYNAAELDGLLNASISYFNALILKSNVKIQNQNLQETKRNLELAEQNFAVGASGKSDVLRLRSQLAQNTQSFIEAGNQLKQSYNSINQLMNVRISNKIDVDDAELAKGLFKDYAYEGFLDLLDNPKLQPALIEFLVEEAKNNAPELKNLGHNLDVIERNYRLNSSGRYMPTVALQGQYNLAISESGRGATVPIGFAGIPDGNYNFGLNVSIPIFQQNKKNINRQKSVIQRDQLGFEKENFELNIERNINDIVLDIVSQIANIKISIVAEEAAKESLELTQNAYRKGAVPVIQLIDAQTNFLQAQLASATANYSYLLGSMQLERAIGYFFLMNSDSDNQAFIQRAYQYLFNKN